MLAKCDSFLSSIRYQLRNQNDLCRSIDCNHIHLELLTSLFHKLETSSISANVGDTCNKEQYSTSGVMKNDIILCLTDYLHDRRKRTLDFINCENSMEVHRQIHNR